MSEKVDIASLNHLRRLVSETNIDVTADGDNSMNKKVTLIESSQHEKSIHLEKAPEEEERLADIGEHRLMLHEIARETKFKLLR